MPMNEWLRRRASSWARTRTRRARSSKRSKMVTASRRRGLRARDQAGSPGSLPSQHLRRVGAEAQAARPLSSRAVTDERVITVVGVGEEHASPDRCHLTIALNAIEPTVAEAMTRVNSVAEQVIATMRGHGIAEADVQTLNLSLQDFFDQDKRAVTARIGSYVLQVKSAVADVGPLLAAVGEVAGDALQVRGIQLFVSDPGPLRALARRRAVEDARARAAQLAAAAGVRLGSLVALAEGAMVANRGFATRAFAGGAGGPIPQVPVEAGEATMTVQVTATFAIED